MVWKGGAANDYDKPCAVLAGEKATQLGWEIYPIGSGAGPGCLPHALLMGLVLVA